MRCFSTLCYNLGGLREDCPPFVFLLQYENNNLQIMKLNLPILDKYLLDFDVSFINLEKSQWANCNVFEHVKL